MMRPSGSPFAHLDLFAAATRARNTDPTTSKASARSLETREHLKRLSATYQKAGHYGLTDEQACELAGIAHGWKRCSDLRRLGFIVATGETRTGKSGRAQMVCRWQGDAP